MFFLVFLNTQLSWGQQVIGQFPTMHGGFETSTIVNAPTYTPPMLNWWNATSSTCTIATSITSRSGDKCLDWSSSSTSTSINSPNSGAGLISSPTISYVIQYHYFKNNTGTARATSIRITSNGTSNFGTAVTSTVMGGGTGGAAGGSGVSTNWSKVAVVASTKNNSYAAANYGFVTILPFGGSFGSYLIDDFCVYQGSAVDTTAPIASSSVTVTGVNPTPTVTWPAASGGVDGGGYVVVRFPAGAALSTNPNQNGIYAVNNTVYYQATSHVADAANDGTVVYIGTASTFNDVGASAGCFYKVYTVDKAFNYSSGTIGALPSQPTAGNSTVAIDAPLLAGTTSTITCTAKDQYNIPVSGYTFTYDVTITNNNSNSTESYTIDGTSRTSSASAISLTAVTNSSGVATITAALPALVDGSDGIAIQVKLNDGTVVGSPFSFTQLTPQTITFNALTPVTYGDADFNLNATSATSGTNAITYTSSNPLVATVLGNVVTITGAGSTNITASQAGNSSYNAAANVVQSLTVNQKTLTIPDASALSRAYNGLLTTNINGTLTGVITTDNTLVGFDGVLKGTFADANVANGIAVTSTCVLTGTRAGNYSLIQPTNLVADITLANQTIVFASTATMLAGISDYSPGATSVTSTANPITYTSSNPLVATIVSGKIHYVGLGQTNIIASQAGGLNYNSASATQLLVVSDKHTWDPGNDLGGFWPIANAVTTDRAVDGLSLIAGGSSFGQVISNSVTFPDGYSSTQRFMSGGASTLSGNLPSKRYLSFEVPGPCEIKVWFRAGGAGLRTVAVSDGTNLLNSLSVTDDAVTGLILTSNYLGATSATIYVYFPAQASNISKIEVVKSTTWDGTAWSNGTPNSSLEAIIAGNYNSTTNGTFSSNKLTVNSGTLTVSSGTTLTVQNQVINSGGSIVIENNANLIQVNNTTNSGNAVVNRNSSALSRLDYTLWSSPVDSQNLLNFSPLTVATRFYTYDTSAGTNGLYSAIASPSTTNFTPGAGYLIRMPDNAAAAPTTQVYNGQFTGVLNNGNVPFTMTDGGAGKRYNLVGNPYPSPITMSSFVTDNANITGTLYFWRKTNGVGTAYCTWAGGTFVTNSNAQSANPNGVIQTGQGFFVEGNGNGTAVLFKNMQRVANTAGQFFRTSDVVENNRIWLNATNSAGAFSQMAVGYMTGATQGIDAFDGKYINDSAVALTSNINNEEYTIQGRALPFVPSDVVPLNFKTTSAGDYTIAIDHVDGLFATGQDVFLVDNVTGTATNLRTNAYTFTAVAGLNDSRFILTFQGALNTNGLSFNDNNVKVYKNSGTLYVNSCAVVMKNVKVFDIQGRLIAEQKAVNATSTAFRDLRLSQQVLIIQVTSEDNIVVNKKVVN